MRILKFSQPQCDSCELLADMLEDRGHELLPYVDETDEVVKLRGVYEINVFEHLDVAMKYNVRVTPTMIVENLWGKEKRRQMGLLKSGNDLDAFLVDAEDDYLR